jgi:hypothetical protein
LQKEKPRQIKEKASGIAKRGVKNLQLASTSKLLLLLTLSFTALINGVRSIGFVRMSPGFTSWHMLTSIQSINGDDYEYYFYRTFFT